MSIAGEECAHERVLGRGGQEHVERGRQSRGGVVEVFAHRAIDGLQEAIDLAHHERLGELFARAELLVQGLTTHARGGGDVAHRDLRPSLSAELVARGVQQGFAQQLARGLGVGSAVAREGDLRRPPAVAGRLALRAASGRGPRSLPAAPHGLEVDLLAHAAVRAGPVVGNVAPGVPAGSPRADVRRLVVDVAAHGTAIAAHRLSVARCARRPCARRAGGCWHARRRRRSARSAGGPSPAPQRRDQREHDHAGVAGRQLGRLVEVAQRLIAAHRVGVVVGVAL